LRRLVQKTEKIVEPYIRNGDTELDVGSGMDYFFIPFGKIVGEKGRVTALDVSIEMLNVLQKHA
jgi:ubiquinone/menaquinone biosynthesis C-methylase UbiE